jgi:hypothetical protein
MSYSDDLQMPEDLRYRHDLMVELYRVEQARDLASARAASADLERLERQQNLIRAALAGLAA